jgi:tetratricopeptide (TPR) repeat protein
VNRQHDVVASLEMSRQDLLICRELGNRHDETASLCNLGNCWLELGECTQARCNLDEGLRLARAVGRITVEPYALIGLSRLALWQGDDALALAHAQLAVDTAIAVQDRLVGATGLFYLGDAEMALGRHEAARAAFERARAVAMAIGVGNHYDAEAGLARAALAQGDMAGAMQAVDGLLGHLASGGTLAGTSWPVLIRLSCYHVLARAGDPRAAEVLASAHAELQARAAAITDTALRHGFLNNVPEHREIVAAYRSFAPSKIKPS